MKKNVVSERDFDVYKIPLPVNFIRKKRRESFLTEELEKLHPRFSANDFFDAKFSIEKGKLVANVAVMNRLIFAKYKNNAGGKTLLLSGNGIKTRPIFTAKEKKVKEIGVAAAILIFGSIALGFGFKIFKGGLYVKGSNLEETDDILATKILEQETAFKQQVSQSISRCQKVFQSVLDCGGLATSFIANENRASFKLKNCYPEKIFGSENCTVSYQNGTPMFALNLESGIEFHKIQTSLSTSLKNDVSGDFISSLREKILECGGSVASEMQGNDKAMLSFSVGCDNLKKTLNAIRILEIEKSWCEKSIEISISGDDKTTFSKANFNLEFLPFSSDESYCNLMAEFCDVFIEKQIKKPLRTQNENLKLASPSQKIRSVGEIASGKNAKKVGVIRGADGKQFYYTRGNDGKIKKEAVGE